MRIRNHPTTCQHNLGAAAKRLPIRSQYPVRTNNAVRRRSLPASRHILRRVYILPAKRNGKHRSDSRSTPGRNYRRHSRLPPDAGWLESQTRIGLRKFSQRKRIPTTCSCFSAGFLPRVKSRPAGAAVLSAIWCGSAPRLGLAHGRFNHTLAATSAAPPAGRAISCLAFGARMVKFDQILCTVLQGHFFPCRHSCWF